MLEPTRQLLEIRRALGILVQPDQIVELRAFDVQGPDGQGPYMMHGYFNDMDTLAKRATELTPMAKGVFMTMNPVKSDLLARVQNKVAVARAGQSVSDDDISYRAWLFIDIDPVRTSDTSSTDEEHQAALHVAERCREYLSGLGWPEPVAVDSGNGAGLFYKIDLPTGDDGLAKKVLGALSFLFDDDKVQIDQVVHNPSRLVKIYGTLARKGEDTTERPHRSSCILSAPEILTMVPVELLEEVAALAPHADSAEAHAAGAKGAFDLDDWIRKYNVPANGPIPWGNKRKYVFDTCPWNPEHTNKSAYIVQFENGAIAAGCHHNGCSDKGWHDLRPIYQKGWKPTRPGGVAGNSPKDAQADQLVQLVEGSGTYTFIDELGKPNAQFHVDDHWEVWPCDSIRFKRWLSMLYYESYSKVLKPTARC